jgi:sulfonate transport system substrate-binding protein
MKRREFLKLSVGSIATVVLAQQARAEGAPKEIRIGTQKGGFYRDPGDA